MTYFLTSQYQGFRYPVSKSQAVVGPPFLRGDCNGDRLVDISDPLELLFALFGGVAAHCPRACDFDSNRRTELADAIGLLNYLFREGPPPGEPFPACGVDPGADGACVGACRPR